MKKGLSIVSMLVTSVFLNFCNSGKTSDAEMLPKDSATLANGKNSYINNCSTCHSLSNDGTGPRLAGITADHSVVWIRNFIRDPKKVIDAGDTTAELLYKKYKTMMPPFGHLPDEEINAIISFVHSQKSDPVADVNDIKNPIPDSIATSDVVADLKLFTQIPASAKERPMTRIVKMDFEPASGELYLLDLRGKLYKLNNGRPTVYMDMATLKPKFIDKPGLNTGFGNFAFHPEFSKNGIVYTTHTEAPGSAKADFGYADSISVAVQWVLTEWKTDPTGFPFKSTSSRELLRVNMPSGIHGVQEISFNPLSKKGSDDYELLYVGIGDGGSVETGHPLVSEVPDHIWGSIIRIDPSGHNSINGQYGIPKSNPFANNASNKFAGEIYAWGFRNPHRYSWTKSGQFLAANIGQANIESVNLVAPGHFYGWPLREGEFVEHFFKEIGKIFALPANDSTFHITYPVAAFDHDEGTAISGGYEYNGSLLPQLKGKYVFNDIATGRLFFVNTRDIHQGKKATIKKWNITFDGMPTSFIQLAKTERVEVRFGMDKKGELYLFSKADGKVYKLVK